MCKRSVVVSIWLSLMVGCGEGDQMFDVWDSPKSDGEGGSGTATPEKPLFFSNDALSQGGPIAVSTGEISFSQPVEIKMRVWIENVPLNEHPVIAHLKIKSRQTHLQAWGKIHGLEKGVKVASLLYLTVSNEVHVESKPAIFDCKNPVDPEAVGLCNITEEIVAKPQDSKCDRNEPHLLMALQTYEGLNPLNNVFDRSANWDDSLWVDPLDPTTAASHKPVARCFSVPH